MSIPLEAHGHISTSVGCVKSSNYERCHLLRNLRRYRSQYRSYLGWLTDWRRRALVWDFITPYHIRRLKRLRPEAYATGFNGAAAHFAQNFARPPNSPQKSAKIPLRTVQSRKHHHGPNGCASAHGTSPGRFDLPAQGFCELVDHLVYMGPNQRPAHAGQHTRDRANPVNRNVGPVLPLSSKR